MYVFTGPADIVHSTPYMQSTSTVLFSAVLFAASKFYRPDLHESLKAHFQTVLDRTVNMAACHLGLIQALMIAVFWRAPTDASAWVKLGIAIRLAYQLRLHQPRQVPLPANEYEARQVAVSGRQGHTDEERRKDVVL